MKRIQIIGSKSTIPISKEWIELQQPQKKSVIHWQGHRYELVGAYQRKISCLHLFARFLWGTALTLATLGFVWKFDKKSVRPLFTERIFQLFYVALICPPEPQKFQKNSLQTPPAPPPKIKTTPPPIDPPKTEPKAKLHRSKSLGSGIAFSPILTLRLKEKHPLLKPLDLEEAEEDLLEMLFTEWNLRPLPCDKATTALIRERLKQWDTAIQLEKRLNHLRPPFLKIKHILPAWNESILKYALLMDEELSSLKLGDVWNQNPTDLEDALGARVRALSKDTKEEIPKPSREAIRELLFKDIAKLKAETINELYKDLPPIAFSLISLSEIPKLDMKLPSKEQTQALFESEERVSKLTILQLHDCLEKVEPASLYSLSNEQCMRIDLSKTSEQQYQVILPRLRGRQRSAPKKCFEEASLDDFHAFSINSAIS